MVAPVDPVGAARLFGAGAELAETIGLVVGLPHKRVHERALAEVRQALGADSFDAEFENGRQLRREQLGAMVTAALDAAARSRANGRPIDGSPNGHGLTPRERDVLRLLEMRLTDREIAERLFVTRKTASKHVSAILAKLGVSDRRAAAAEAMRRGITTVMTAETTLHANE
jgi:DNA-binding NarL/FixJ family response regulator